MARSNRPSRQHIDVAREAGFGRLSFISVLAGLVTAYGAFAIVASIAGAILTGVDAETEFRSNDWTGSGAVAGLVTAIVLLVAYLFGGYVAGRMGRRAAILHGVAVFVGSLVVAAVVSGLVALVSDDDQLRTNLRSLGIPTTFDQVTGVAVAALIASLAAMLVGSVWGALMGERWHTKLARRAADPEIGPAADLRRRAAQEDEGRRDRVDADPVVRDEVAARAAGGSTADTGAESSEPVVIDDRVVDVGRTKDEDAVVEEHQVVTERPTP